MLINSQPKGSHRLRIGRISASDAIYFVTTNIKHREPLLASHENQEIMHASLQFSESSGWVYWFCYNIMPDHVHVLLRLDKAKSLSTAVQSIKKWTSRRFNKDRSNRSAWQPGYFDHRIRSESDFYETVVYIFINPVESGLVDDGRKWGGFRAKPEIEQWIKKWAHDKARLESWMVVVRRKMKAWEPGN